MGRIAYASSAVLALAGSSYGFLVDQIAIRPGAEIRPSVGGFMNYYGGYWLSGRTPVVNGNRASWNNYSGEIQSASKTMGFVRNESLADESLRDITMQALEEQFSPEFLGRLDHQVKVRGFRIEVGVRAREYCKLS